MYILMGFSGHAASAGRASAARATAMMRRTIFSSSLFSLEHGLALLHERAPALGVILALEALENKVPAKVAVEVVAELEHLLDDPLARLDRERRPGRDGGGVLPEQRL